MAWEYRLQPEQLAMPACPFCANRGRVSCFAQAAYFCGDCQRSFVAVWREEKRVRLKERAAS